MADLPSFGIVSVAGEQRIAGELEETEIGGVQFVKVKPHGHHSVLVNPAHIVTIAPCTEPQARLLASRQWAS